MLYIVCVLTLLSVTASERSCVTGRTSMSPEYPVQCQMSYSGSEQIQGYPVVGVDGTTFGSLYDGGITKQCGSKVSIQGVVHIIVDRIWQNDGVNGSVYDTKNNADTKTNPIKSGYPQYDTASYTFYQRGGNNEWLNVTKLAE